MCYGFFFTDTEDMSAYGYMLPLHIKMLAGSCKNGFFPSIFKQLPSGMPLYSGVSGIQGIFLI